MPLSQAQTTASSPTSLAGTTDVTDRTARLLGHVTVDTAPPDVVFSGTITAADTTTITGNTAGIVEVLIPDGYDSYQVQFSGTFSAGTIIASEGTTYGESGVNPPALGAWFGVQARRNGTPPGQTAEATSTTGANSVGGWQAWLGLVSARRRLRFRCTTFTAGDSVTIHGRLSHAAPTGVILAALPTGANMLGSTGTQFGFYAYVGAGYGITSGRLSPSVAVASANILTLFNPAASTKTLYLYRISVGGSFGAVVAGQFDRVRFTAAPTGGTATTALSRNSSATASVAAATRASVTAGTPVGATLGASTLEKSVVIFTGGQDTSTEDGSLILPPGTGVAVQYTTTGTATTVTAEIVWWEV